MEVGWAVEVSGDTSRCQTHRCTAAKDSSSQLPLEAQLDTGIRWSRERTVDVGRGSEGGRRGGDKLLTTTVGFCSPADVKLWHFCCMI